MLGDLPQGNGDPSLAIFAACTPNQHAIRQTLPIAGQRLCAEPAVGRRASLDRVVRILLLERHRIPDWVRSYPGGNSNDALTYTPKGFIWSQAEKMGLNVKMYGEWSGEQTINGSYTWADFYNTALYKETKGAQGKNIVPDDSVSESTTVPSAAKILDPHFPSFNTGIPDQYRVDYYLPILKKQMASHAVPNLTIIWLPDDHTSGYTPGYPVPASAQADNDLALGRIVDAVSHDSVWKDSAIFVEEDDSQDGVDHVDGHRQPVYIISPYTAAPQSPGVGKVHPYRVHSGEHQSHDRAHSRAHAAHPVRSDRHADVQCVPGYAEPRAVHLPAGDHGAQSGSERTHQRHRQGEFRAGQDAHAKILDARVDEGHGRQDRQGGLGG